MIWFKYLRLIVVRVIRKSFNKVTSIIPYVFLFLSFITCMVILFTSYFVKVPVVSYYISEHELPIVYTLQGAVKILDKNDEIVNKNVEIFIGGYHTSVASTEFELRFSSPPTEEVPVIIRFEIDGEVREVVKSLLTENGKLTINEEFIIRA